MAQKQTPHTQISCYMISRSESPEKNLDVLYFSEFSFRGKFEKNKTEVLTSPTRRYHTEETTLCRDSDSYRSLCWLKSVFLLSPYGNELSIIPIDQNHARPVTSICPRLHAHQKFLAATLNFWHTRAQRSQDSCDLQTALFISIGLDRPQELSYDFH